MAGSTQLASLTTLKAWKSLQEHKTLSQLQVESATLNMYSQRTTSRWLRYVAKERLAAIITSATRVCLVYCNLLQTCLQQIKNCLARTMGLKLLNLLVSHLSSDLSTGSSFMNASSINSSHSPTKFAQSSIQSTCRTRSSLYM